MSSEGSLSMSLSDMRKEIECDQCAISNPSKRCSRCHISYYCSADCQRSHWKIHKLDCTPVDETKNDLVGVTNIATSSTTDEGTNSTSAKVCSLCLSETAENPIGLPLCGHTFCFACLMEWENHRYTKNSLLAKKDRSTPQQRRCPKCRESMNVSIVDAAIEKAYVYAAAGRLTVKVYDHHLKTDQETVAEIAEVPLITLMDERKEKFCKLAMEQLNQVLNSDPTDIITLCTKGQILRYVRPHDAINAFHELLRIDEEGGKTIEKVELVMKDYVEYEAHMKRTLTSAEFEGKRHPMHHELAKRAAVAKNLMKTPERGIQLGKGYDRLFTLKVWLAEAFESANEYKKAEAVYKEVFKEAAQFGYTEYIKNDPRTCRLMLTGTSRCLFYVKDFVGSKELARMALGTCRHYPGVHILIAQSQWALNEKKAAIRTMCRGVLYEAPWDKSNQKLNRIYLQEFIDAMSGTI